MSVKIRQGDDSTVWEYHAEIQIPLVNMIGWSAERVRSLGGQVPDNVPDVAVLAVRPDGEFKWLWPEKGLMAKVETHRRTLEEKQDVQGRMAAVNRKLEGRGIYTGDPWWKIAEKLLSDIDTLVDHIRGA